MKHYLKKKNVIIIYEIIDIIFIINFIINIRMVENLNFYYLIRLLDIYKLSRKASKLRIMNTIVHSFYRIWCLKVLSKKSYMYSWMKDLSYISLIYMKIINLGKIEKLCISYYVWIKHLYYILKIAKMMKSDIEIEQSKKISNINLFKIHLIESYFHYFFFTKKNVFIKN